MKTSQVPAHVPADRVFDFDMYADPEVQVNCHAAYARLQRLAPPVFFTPRNGGHWMITRHDLMSEIVRDHEHFSTRVMHIPAVSDAPMLLPLTADPPQHTIWRQILAPYFAPKSVARMNDDLQAFAREVVAGVAARGECDFVRDVAAPFPVTVFMRMMGLPLERFDDFRLLADRFFNAHGDDVAAASAPIVAELGALLAARRAKRDDGRDDLISHLLDARMPDGEPVAEDKLLSMCFLLFLGGLDTVTNALSFAIRNLAERPELQKRLVGDPSLVASLLDESLRQYGVVNTPRIVARDCERFGVQFRAGDMVLVPLPIAGWDDGKNADPEVFDIDRATRSHLTFSTGPHLCLGHFLARAEMRCLLGEWVAQVGEFSIADGYRPHYRVGTVMALESLPLRWAASAGN